MNLRNSPKKFVYSCEKWTLIEGKKTKKTQFNQTHPPINSFWVHLLSLASLLVLNPCFVATSC